MLKHSDLGGWVTAHYRPGFMTSTVPQPEILQQEYFIIFFHLKNTFQFFIKA